MNWKEKMDALSALDEDISIKYRESKYIGERKLEPWYVNQRVEIKKGGMLKSVSGNGETVEEAIEDHWRQVTELESGEYIVIDPGGENRQAVKWNGFMWKNVIERMNYE